MDIINIIIIAAMLECSNPPLKRMCKLNVHLCIPWKCSVPSSIVIIQHTTASVSCCGKTQASSSTQVWIEPTKKNRYTPANDHY